MAQLKLVLQERPLTVRDAGEHRLLGEQRFKWWERVDARKKPAKKVSIFYFN